MTRARKVLVAIRVGEYCAWAIPYAISEGARADTAAWMAQVYYDAELLHIERS